MTHEKKIDPELADQIARDVAAEDLSLRFEEAEPVISDNNPAKGLQVHLLTHAETPLHHPPNRYIGGSNEQELSLLGKGQARNLGERFRQQGILPDEAYTGPQHRCTQMARLVLNCVHSQLAFI